MTTTRDAEQVRQTVREGYAKVAEGGRLGAACCGPQTGGCGTAPASPEAFAASLGYTAEALAALPEGANMGLSCGNPTAIAGLEPGQTVVDLGSGGGLDCFLASPKVGAGGRVIGVDMTPAMLHKARASALRHREQGGLDNVEFRLGEIEHLPVADASVDVVLSNCVINLSPDKPQVWRDVARVLKPGGRVSVSDVALLRPLPTAVAERVEALIGCVAGAATIDDTRAALEAAGLTDIEITPKPEFMAALAQGADPIYADLIAELPAGTGPADFVTSVTITARRPA